MARIVSVHSFRGGTGKSNITANLTTILANRGMRVGVVDTDIRSPGIHVLFGLDEAAMVPSLNDYIWGVCSIEQAARPVTERVGMPLAGEIYLIPASIHPDEIARVVREGYDIGLLCDGYQRLISTLKLDVLLIDTHAGLNEEALLSLAISDTVAVILRPDQQDYQGTRVSVDMARKLGVPDLLLVVNKVPLQLAREEVQAHVETTYKCEVGAILTHADEMMMLASSDIFGLRYPDHPLTVELQKLAARVTS